MSSRLQTRPQNAPTSSPSFTPAPAVFLQRKCACGGASGLTSECEACDRKPILQRQRNAQSEASAVPTVVDDVLGSPGEPLEGATRSFMESRFGHDFGRVRVHTDARAAESARSVKALAYTVGQNVVFDTGQYAPNTRSGRHTLAHELAHVVQQNGAAIRVAQKSISPADSKFEREADRVADSVVDGETIDASSMIGASGPDVLQRQSADTKTAPTTEKPATPQEEEEFVPGCAKSVPGCSQEAVGQDVDSLLRMDTVTVVELSSAFCAPCKGMSDDLAELCAEFATKPQRVRFRVFCIDKGRKENKEVLEHINKQTGSTATPQTFVFTERKQSAFYSGYAFGSNVKDEIRRIHETASEQGVYTGMKWGSIIGGVVGGIAGAFVGGGIASQAGKDVLGGVLGGGLIGGVIGAAVGLGIGALIGALFSKDIGTTALSESRTKEVKEYLAFLEKGVIRGDSEGDDLARDAVTLWVDNKAKLNLRPEILRLMVLEMLDGTVSRADQRAILKIIENASDIELLHIFRLSDKPNLLELEAIFDGDEKEYLLKLFEPLRKRFPVFAPVQETKGLLIGLDTVRTTLAAAFNATHMPEPGKVLRECCGAFIQKQADQSVQAEPAKPHCEERTDCPTNKVVYDAVQKSGKGHRIAGSYHTHPLKPPPQARLAPSAADLKPGFQGPEHYVVDPFNVNLIQFGPAGAAGFRILGPADQLLGVKRIEPPKGLRSTLEIG